MYSFAAAVLLLTVSCDRKKAEVQSEQRDTIPKTAEVKLPDQKSKPFLSLVGTEPFWNIEFTNDSLHYTSPNPEDEFKIAYKESVSEDSNVRKFEAQDESKKISIVLNKENCSDGMSDRKFRYSANVSILKTGSDSPLSLKGCGDYVVDEDLDGKWFVVEIAGQKLKAENLKNKELPEVTFNVRERRFTASAGCNGIGGELNPGQESFNFAEVVATQMMCENIKVEENLLEALNATKKLERRDDRLYLLDIDGTKAVLSKNKN